MQPTSADDVVIDGTSAGVTIPSGVTALCRSCNVSGGKLTWAAAASAVLRVGDASGGAFTASASSTLTGTQGTLSFVSTADNGGAGWNITCAGKSFPLVLFDGVGGRWHFVDDMNAAGSVTVTNGAVDWGTTSPSMTSFQSNNTNVRSVLFGGCPLVKITIATAATVTPWNLSTTNMTFTAPAELRISGAHTGNRTLQGANLVMNVVKVTAGSDAALSLNNWFCTDLDFTGFSGTWVINPCNVSGNLTLDSRMGVPATAATLLTLAPPAGTTKTVTTNGSRALSRNIDINGSPTGTVQLVDDLDMTGSSADNKALRVVQGIFRSQGHTMRLNSFRLDITGGTNREAYLGASQVYFTTGAAAAASALQVSATPPGTVDMSGATVSFTVQGAFDVTVQLSGFSLGVTTFHMNGTGSLLVNGGGGGQAGQTGYGFASLAIDGTSTGIVKLNTGTKIVNGALAFNGTAAHPLVVQSQTPGTYAPVQARSTAVAAYTTFTDIDASSGTYIDASDGTSHDGGHNLGIIFIKYVVAPAGGIVRGGSAASSLVRAAAPAGGVALGGAAGVTYAGGAAPAGGAVQGGAADTAATYVYVPGGGVVHSGNADNTVVYEYTQAGGVQHGGSTDTVRGFYGTPLSGAAYGGTVASSAAYGSGPTGGAAQGGAATNTWGVVARPVGGPRLGGLAWRLGGVSTAVGAQGACTVAVVVRGACAVTAAVRGTVAVGARIA